MGKKKFGFMSHIFFFVLNSVIVILFFQQIFDVNKRGRVHCSLAVRVNARQVFIMRARACRLAPVPLKSRFFFFLPRKSIDNV